MNTPKTIKIVSGTIYAKEESLQYFSKLYKKWMDFKITDCRPSLERYFYKIRIKQHSKTGQPEFKGRGGESGKMKAIDTRRINEAKELAAKRCVVICDAEYCDAPDTCIKVHYHLARCMCLDCGSL